MSRSGCKESKVAGGAFILPSQHNHNPSKHGDEHREKDRERPREAEQLQDGVLVEMNERYKNTMLKPQTPPHFGKNVQLHGKMWDTPSSSHEKHNHMEELK